MAKHLATVHPDAEAFKGKSSDEIQREFRRVKALKERARARNMKSSTVRSTTMAFGKVALVVVLVLAMIGVAYYLVSLPNAKTGSTAPNFEVFDSDGYPFRVADQTGKPVLIYFMRGTWCPTCKASMPALMQAWDSYKGRGLVMITIDLDASESVNDLKAYKDGYGAGWRFALDTANAGGTYGATATVGFKVYIDKSGVIVATDGGVASFDKMKPNLDRIVGS